ncbi:MAG: hypothetical protein LBU38_01305 [Propionibacteriaceae bacterium]|jgi:cytochrome c biogenesis protein CcdA|nr:hypothetical protein [Propionibacteriaceae bacterium]
MSALIPDNPRTGEPRRPWTIMLGLTAFFTAIANEAAAIFWCYWVAVTDYPNAAWLFELIPSLDEETVSINNLVRVLLVVAVTLGVVLISAAAGIAGFYAYQGYRWARVVAIIAFVLSGLSVLLNAVAWPAIGLCFVGAFALWLPPSGKFFKTWLLRRYPQPAFEPTIERVYYGPLPRYQS